MHGEKEASEVGHAYYLAMNLAFLCRMARHYAKSLSWNWVVFLCVHAYEYLLG